MKTWITPILCCLLLIAAGCGKKGDPVPQDKKNLFSWESADAALTGNGCLAISALMKGAARNVDGFSIELEPLAASADSTLPKELQTPQDSCEGCPFTPRETQELTPQQAVPTDSGTRFAFTYCPQTKAAAYRWRLVARNVFMAFPYALTPVKTPLIRSFGKHCESGEGVLSVERCSPHFRFKTSSKKKRSTSLQTQYTKNLPVKPSWHKRPLEDNIKKRG